MRKLLVTGGAGFIGSNFVRMVLSEHPDCFIVNLDKLTYAGNLENLAGFENHPNHKFSKGDICDGALVEKIVEQQKEAQNLGNSLKYLLQTPKLRGNYGEEILEDIRLNQTGWEGNADIVTFNQQPIGMTVSGNIEIDRWWPSLKKHLAENLAEKLSEGH